MTKELTIIAPDDWHIHLRDNDALKTTVPHAAQSFQRAIIMPNTVPPISNTAEAHAYLERITKYIPKESQFKPLMTLYLTRDMTPEIIHEAKASGMIHAVKLYPAGVTTNSQAGVASLEQLYPVFEAMAEVGMPFLTHGEVANPSVDIFDREPRFIEEELMPLKKRFPTLRVVMEHITTKDAVDYVMGEQEIAATITPQHLLYNRNHLLSGGLKPHFYCLPILKRELHREALVKAATSGNSKFFIGTDSAPHAKGSKENSCGCAGCYSALTAVPLYAEAFDEANALDQLEAFLSKNGADFYRMPYNTTKITLKKSPWQPPQEYPYINGDVLVPLGYDRTLSWQVLSQ